MIHPDACSQIVMTPSVVDLIPPGFESEQWMKIGFRFQVFAAWKRTRLQGGELAI